MATRETPLTANWLWKERDPSISSVLDELALSGWNKAQAVPSEIHVELLKIGKIPDPYIGDNEHKVQWVGERDWLYQTTFAFDKAEYAQALIEFEGLDTLCTIYLNGRELLRTDNQFTPYTLDLAVDSLNPVKNVLLLHFTSAKLVAKEQEKLYGRVRAGSCNLGDPSRVYVRKAQYDWRWDWGPELMTAGPWRPVILKQYNTRISSVNTKAEVSPAPDLRPSLAVDVSIAGDLNRVAALQFVMQTVGGDVIRTERRKLDCKIENPDVIQWKFEKDEVRLWWPVGEGEQMLYDVEIYLQDANGAVMDKVTKRIGFRRVELVQEELSEADQYGKGTSFLFEVNGRRIFIGGSNWVPGDNFLTTITPERYRAWLQLLKDGNQNMVRLWGGGVYEPDIFYDTCDELGIMVWQDFQFACGVYPAHATFVASVKREAEENVTRLRHHPSLALFCGNNEDYQMVLQWGGIDQLPARVLYEEVLPDVVSRLTSPAIPYWRGSPYGGKGWDTADPTVGDVHQWNIWGGAHLQYQEYDVMGGRFVSEFGLPSIPDMRTVNYWLADAPASQRYSQSKLMMQHNKAGLHERRFAILMNENFRITSDFETYCYLTQLMQSEGVGHAYRSWRREWRGKGREYCSGVIVWQLNDCWPGSSWAIADYFLRPKAVYYTIARSLRPLTVGIARVVHQNRENDRPRQFYEFGAFQSISATMEVWGTNSTQNVQEVTLELQCFDLESEWTHAETHAVKLSPNQATEILSMPVPHRADTEATVTPSWSVVVSARLLDAKGGVLARYADWPQPYRSLELPDPGLLVTVDGEGVTVEVARPVKGLVLSAEGEGEEVKWSDNNLDVVPGDRQVVVARGLGGRSVRVVHLGKES